MSKLSDFSKKVILPLVTFGLTSSSFLILTRFIYKSNVWPLLQLENVEGKVFVLTGGCRGIGYYVAKHLAQNNAKVVMACRNQSTSCSRNIQLLNNKYANIDHRQVDLDSFESIGQFTDYVSSTYPRIDAIINNAATISKHYKSSHDGNLSVFQINFYAPCLIALSLVKNLQQSPHGGQILNVGCRGNLMKRQVRVDYITGDKYLRPKTQYLLSKNLLLVATHEMARLLRQTSIRCNYIDPGHAMTWLYKDGPFYWFFLVPLYYFIFSSAQEASISIINATTAKKYKEINNSMFIISKVSPMPQDMVNNKRSNKEIWSHLLKRIRMTEEDIINTLNSV